MSHDNPDEETVYPQSPSWFNLDRYKVCEGWGLGEWYFALKSRSPFIHTETIEANRKHPKPDEEWVLQQIALRTISQDLAKVSGITKKLGELCEQIPIIQDHRITDSADIEKYLTSISNRKKIRLSDDEMVFISSFAERRSVTVNLNAPRELFLQKCAEYYDSHLRLSERKKIATKYDDKDFKEWHRTKILPYLDLVIYSKFVSKLKITEREIWDIFYKDKGLYKEGHINRTVKDNAIDLTSSAALCAMEAQLKEEIF